MAKLRCTFDEYLHLRKYLSIAEDKSYSVWERNQALRDFDSYYDMLKMRGVRSENV